jgi:hypothetical protein
MTPVPHSAKLGAMGMRRGAIPDHIIHVTEFLGDSSLSPALGLSEPWVRHADAVSGVAPRRASSASGGRPPHLFLRLKWKECKSYTIRVA